MRTIMRTLRSIPMRTLRTIMRTLRTIMRTLRTIMRTLRSIPMRTIMRTFREGANASGHSHWPAWYLRRNRVEAGASLIPDVECASTFEFRNGRIQTAWVASQLSGQSLLIQGYSLKLGLRLHGCDPVENDLIQWFPANWDLAPTLRTNIMRTIAMRSLPSFPMRTILRTIAMRSLPSFPMRTILRTFLAQRHLHPVSCLPAVLVGDVDADVAPILEHRCHGGAA